MKPGETNRATAFQAVFDAVKGTVELTGCDATGQPQVEGPDASMRADRLIFDRARGSFSGFGNYLLIFKSGAIKDIFNSTNSPAAPARKSSAPPP
jgi:lipopolysaccharide export system protein LptA